MNWVVINGNATSILNRIVLIGPDICGPGTKKVHAIFNYKGKNVLIKKDIRCKDDVYTHLYTFIIRPDNTYEVNIILIIAIINIIIFAFS